MPDAANDNVMFDTIAIVGVGLIGGSLGMAAKKRGLAHRVIGVGRTEQKLMRAKILGAIDEYSLDMEHGASEADLVVLCPPVQMITPTLEKMTTNIKKGAIVTDVGSTKREVVEDAEILMLEGRHFIGGHPMTGSEQAGVEAAFSDLFLGATYVLTPTEDSDLTALGSLTAFVEAIGARVEIMDPARHDEAVAVISHLPHALAGALLQLADARHRKSGKVFNLASGSFKDLTRISDSPPEIWRDICITNAGSLAGVIADMQEVLGSFKTALEAGDQEAIMSFFEHAGAIRKTYLRITK